MPAYYWHRCPKCGYTISTPLQRLEAWCLRCGKRMTPHETKPQPSPAAEAPLCGGES